MRASLLAPSPVCATVVIVGEPERLEQATVLRAGRRIRRPRRPDGPLRRVPNSRKELCRW